MPCVSFNYLGNISKSSNAFWSIDDKYCGSYAHTDNSRHTETLSINGFSANDEMYFNAPLCIAKSFEKWIDDVCIHTESTDRFILTPSDIGYIINKEDLDELQKDKDIEAVYLANSLQQGFLYHSLSQGDVDDAYVVQHMFDYQSCLNLEMLKEAWH